MNEGAAARLLAIYIVVVGAWIVGRLRWLGAAPEPDRTAGPGGGAGVGGHLGGPFATFDDGILVTHDDVGAQYQPPSTNGVRVRSNSNVSLPSSTLAASTRCERPLAIDL